MSEKDKITDSGNINSSNIFEEFEDNAAIQKELNEKQKELQKDLWFYLLKVGTLFQVTFFILFFFTLIAYLYLYLQKDETLVNSRQLDPFCNIFLGTIPNTDVYCSSVSGILNKYLGEYEQEKIKQTKDIVAIIDSVYKIENFTKSKDVVFLATQGENRVMPIEILQAFDDLKMEYDPQEKEKIQCEDVFIMSDNTFRIKCSAFAAGFEKGIKGFDGTNNSYVQGTSISIANSFINFIEKTSKVFQVQNRQKSFSSQQIIGDKTGFTNKTIFNIELQYSPNNLSL